MNRQLPNITRMAVIVRKELLVLLGNKISRMLIIVPPLAQIIIFGWAATLEVKNVQAAYLNRDSGYWSRQILHAMEGAPTFKSILGLDGEFQIADMIDSQQALLVLVFDEEFSRKIERGQPAEVQVLLDGRRANAAQIVSGYLNDIIAGIVAQNLAGGRHGQSRVNIETRSWFNPNLDFQWFFLPNLIGMITLIIGLVVTGLSVARERETGTFDQLLVSPATPSEIALAKLVPGCLIGLAHGTIFILIAIFGFGVPLHGSLLLLYIAMLIFAFACGAVGLMISSISSTQQQAFLGAFTVGVPCILISGAITPVLNMPPFLQHLSQLNPLRHFTVIAQGVFLKEITASAALLNLGKILLISLVAVSIAVWMFKCRS